MECTDLVSRLLAKRPQDRLGAGSGSPGTPEEVTGIQQVQSHAWFSALDWGALERKEVAERVSDSEIKLAELRARDDAHQHALAIAPLRALQRQDEKNPRTTRNLAVALGVSGNPQAGLAELAAHRVADEGAHAVAVRAATGRGHVSGTVRIPDTSEQLAVRGAVRLADADGTVTVSFAAANATALLLPAGGSAAAAVVKPAAPEAEYENWWGCKEGKSAGR